MSSPLHLAGRIGGVPAVLEALEEAAGAGLLSEREGHDGLPEAVFVHPLQRAAVRQGLSARRRLALHAAAALLVTDPGEALHHRVRAAVAPDDELAAELSAAAVRYAADGAWSAAAAQLLAAARIGADLERRDELLLQAVEYLLLAGDIGQAEELSGTVRGIACSDTSHSNPGVRTRPAMN
ncbi:hypothetical protein OG883_40170 [Streptomyces sp. NBC_01142]|uniref:hypothetical protein n=1 Tax=Streptomyces sp. NBC_01142 TaxID=2975865 RepID=UPI00224CA907|nr:hypothetical protein [Streptomyces sp. NBC_01142]MCX4825918.1 hypothetical protein [Streptomyces sp. NBC_01142]